MLRAKLEKLEIWLFLFARNADVVQRADGDEDERQADDLEHAPQRDRAEAHVEVEAGEVVEPEPRSCSSRSRPAGADPFARSVARRRAS